jgi:hypothetical protein
MKGISPCVLSRSLIHSPGFEEKVPFPRRYPGVRLHDPGKTAEIQQATDNNVLIIGDRVLLPVGAIFKVQPQGLAEAIYLNALANRTNEEIIPRGQINERYAGLQKSQRGDSPL